MKRRRHSALNNWATLSILVAVSACGGGGDAAGPPPPDELATASTLAYVVTECRDDAEGRTVRQSLRIRQGNQAPITVVEHSAVGSADVSGLCALAGSGRAFFRLFGVFHRLGVTPDASQVVFEVTDKLTDDFLASVFPPNTLPAEQEGIFAVRADGTGLHRLGPASRDPPARGTVVDFIFRFSPNGRKIVYTDRGPSRDNQDAVQIVTLDLATGERRQVTQLPLTGQSASFGGTYAASFNDDQTISFLTDANVDGTNPKGESISVTVEADGRLTVSQPAVAIPGSQVATSVFRITGSEVSAFILFLPGEPVNPGGLGFIQEVFVIDRDNNLLQLTNFRRQDTWTPTVSADGHRVFFSASTDKLGTNPTENCQIFSIDRTGGDLRQLTAFHEGPEGRHSPTGCHSGRPPLGCTVFNLSRDTQSQALVFYSTCDPFGTNPFGAQLFAMHEDGTGLHQLTDTRGYTREGGAVSVELPYPFAKPGESF